MREIRSRKRRAGRAVAARVERREIAREGGVEEVELAVVRHRAPVASAARRIDAVEEIQPGVDRFQKVADGADAHEIARLFLRKHRRRCARRRVHLLARFADRESADRVARKIELDDLARAALAQRRVEAALHDSKERGRRRLARCDGAPRPKGRQAHRLFERVTRRGKLHADVEHHRNIAPDGFLKSDDVLRRKAMHAAVEMRAKRDAVVIDLTPALQTENLKPARIGKNRPFPSHKRWRPPAPSIVSSPGRNQR